MLELFVVLPARSGRGECGVGARTSTYAVSYRCSVEALETVDLPAIEDQQGQQIILRVRLRQQVRNG
jgi:hypothetical protein